MRRGGLVFVEQPGSAGAQSLLARTARQGGGRIPPGQPSDHGRHRSPPAELLQDPARFDVILADGVCGAVLAGEAAGLTGSAGMMSCAMIGNDRRGLYHPVLGPSPDMAGQNLANPVGAVYAGALLLKYAFDLAEECAPIEAAVQRVLDDGYRTADIMTHRCRLVSCDCFGDLIAAALTSPLLYRRGLPRHPRCRGQFRPPWRRRVTGAAQL